ncbi:HD domain-containing protein [Abortiporus biennis]|nr:HD domain-containing protein [Abortiporus biennis]
MQIALRKFYSGCLRSPNIYRKGEILGKRYMSESSVPKRAFPPLYVSQGTPSLDRLAFFHILEKLKTQKRTGWIDFKVPEQESIADHMYRMAMFAMCATDKTLDISKCVMLCIVHDLAEAQVGDITPREGISKAEKRRLEEEAIHNFVHEMLHDTPIAQRIDSLWKEYEEQTSDEAKFVKDLDRFEMASQAFEYERNHNMKTLQQFFDTSLPFIKHPEVRQWGEDLAAEREKFYSSQSS